MGAKNGSRTETRLCLREYDDGLAETFYRINAEWITAMYRMEASEDAMMRDPRRHYIDGGGAILFAEHDTLGIVGTCALRPARAGALELTKMGVLERARGSGAGAFLLSAAIERAGRLGASLLFLLTNRKSAAAIHLYEKHGFVHDTAIMAEFGSTYERCDVAMRYAGHVANA